MSKTDVPVSVVAGGLTVGPYNVFDAAQERPVSDLIRSFEAENKGRSVGWSGHIWCDFNGLIGDASIFMTGQVNPKSMLYRVAKQNLYDETNFILKASGEFSEIEYRPHYVLTRDEVSSLVQGAIRHLNQVVG